MKSMTLIIGTLLVSTMAWADIRTGTLRCELRIDGLANNSEEVPLTMYADGSAHPSRLTVQLADVSCVAEGRLGVNQGGVESQKLILPDGGEYRSDVSRHESPKTMVSEYWKNNVRILCVCNIVQNPI